MKAKGKRLLKADRLKPGDKIGIVAPAGAIEKTKFYRGIEMLAAWGFEIYVPDGLLVKDRYLAGSDYHRAGLVNRLFGDKTVKAIICARGGYGSMRLLPLLDYRAIKKNPKVFVGFSDITVLLSILYSRCGLVVFHGPVVSTLETSTQKSRNAFYAAVTSAERTRLVPKNGLVLQRGVTSGPVVGGNLTTLCHLTGTPYAPSYKGHVLMLEEKGEPVYRIDRMLTQMKLSGSFDDIAGLALGTFKDCGNKREIYQLIAAVFADNKIPVLAGFDFGHGRGNVTFPIGLEATLDTDRQVLSYSDASTIAHHG